MKKGFRVTKKRIKEEFDILNDMLFDGKLTYFKTIKLLGEKELPHVWAYCTYDLDNPTHPMLEIQKYMDTEFQFINVLAHEMVHVWQVDVAETAMSHGRSFFEWKKLFEHFGLELDISVDEQIDVD